MAAIMTDYPVKNTFVEFPARRSLSLDDFFEERDTQSCPGSALVSRLQSLEEDFPTLGGNRSDRNRGVLHKVDSRLKNTFVDQPSEFPALRSFSLEEFLVDREIVERDTKSCPGSGVMGRLESLEEEPEPSAPVTPSLGSSWREEPVKPQLGVVGSPVTSDRSTEASFEDCATPTSEEFATPPSEKWGSQPQTWIGLNMHSAGSVGHENGCGKPRAVVWKEKLTWRRAFNKLASMARFGC